jgi:taurine dioxygenase
MRLANQGASQRAPLSEEQKKQVPDVVHPIVRTHPISGKKSLYVNEGFTTRVEGVSAEESDKILKDLFESIKSEKYMYRHKWKAGDLIMWDNCSAQHLAIADYGTHQPRLMHRTTVTGTLVF